MVTKKCLEILSSGGVIIYPTDTVYGIGCDATNLNSILKVNEIKNRKSDTPLICLMNSMEMVKNYVTNLPDISEKYLLDSIEPTTVIFSKSKNIDSYPKSIAIRIPKNNEIRSNIHVCGNCEAIQLSKNDLKNRMLMK